MTLQFRPALCIFALPRSRTAWLAHWLRRDGLLVGHDIAIECDEPGQFIASYHNGMAGTVETGAIEAWRLLHAALPGLRLVTIRRPLAEVEASLAAFGLEAHDELLLRDAMLDEIEALGLAERLDYEALESIPARKWLWDYCRGDHFDPQWDASFAVTNIQVNMAARITQLLRRGPAMNSLRAQVSALSSELSLCPTLN